ncbi:AAA family ATPase [Acinetobacter indicus]|uniref:AAA family ATPase n=1 Tax=Acinetobacter indicus TaxID=756892 RepID=UPI001443F4CA|nr:AAA family ATPase [Acinetobacter indicus]
MKLTKFTIKNFRSITDGSEIHFGNYSVLVGKNNEGKTTVLMALRLAMDTLKLHAYQLPNTKRTIFKLKNAYEWDRDFPISLQEKPRIKKVTTFKIDFELSEIEKIEFRKEVGSKINGSLCIEISFDENNISTVLVPKRGSAALSKKSNQIAKYIANKIQFTYIPAIRTEHEAIGVINEMIEEELSKLESESKFKEALDVIEEWLCCTKLFLRTPSAI